MKAVAWESVGRVPPRELVEARLLLHHAAQLLACVGRSLAPPQADDGHTSLTWRRGPGRLLGVEAPGKRPWHAALAVEEMVLSVVTDEGDAGRLPLLGAMPAEAFAWLVSKARELGAPAERLTLKAPYELPPNPSASGAAMAPPRDGALREMACWFGNGDALMRAVAEGRPGAAPVRIWPHHFDVGSVLPLGLAAGESAPQIGVGLSPGDEGIAEPYLYVTPWPVPDPLPDLPAGGRWHREGWTGALLTGSEIVAEGEGAAQAGSVLAFLGGTVETLLAKMRPVG